MESQQQFMQQQQQQQPPTTQSELADPDEMQHMWQFLDSSLTTGNTPNGLPPQSISAPTDSNTAAVMMHAQYAPPPHNAISSSSGSVHPHVNSSAMLHANGATMQPPHLHTRQISDEMRDNAPPLNDDDNGMYNELGDVFSMFFNIDSDETQPHNGSSATNAAAALAHAQHLQSSGNGGLPNGTNSFVGAPRFAPTSGSAMDADQSAKVLLARSVSTSSSLGGGLDSLSPGAGYPSMSPATMNWLQSLGKSSSSDSLMGLVSPATLYGTPGSAFPGSAGAFPGSANSLADGTDLLERTPSCEMIDWKAYNEAGEKTAKEAAAAAPKWRVIPQHGPHADAAPPTAGYAPAGRPPTGSTQQQQSAGELSHASDGGLRDHFTRQFQTIKSTVASIVGALATDTHATNTQSQPPLQYTQASAPLPQMPMLSQSAQEQLARATKRLADDKNKRKAIISPEYVQYGSSSSSAMSASMNALPVASIETNNIVKVEAHVMATQVPDPTGRRPSKKTLHHTAHDQPLHESTVSISPLSATGSLSLDGSTDDTAAAAAIRCKCTGKCRNARCACVKAGFVCGVHCKCVSCANPFVPMARAGIAIQTMVRDVCLMQFLSKVKDMGELLESRVAYDCCGAGHDVAVKETIEHGFECPQCATRFTYSWCSNRLCSDAKKPRKHCAKCRRCGDHRNEHCDACNHCYFAGVANSFSCSCKGGKSGAGSASASTSGATSGSGRIVGTTADALRDSSNSNASLYATAADSSSSGIGALARDSTSALLGQTTAAHGSTGGASSTPATATTRSSGSGIVDGLSSTDAEKDDACPVQ